MHSFSFAGAIALAVAASTPASAALFTYDFTSSNVTVASNANQCSTYACQSQNYSEGGASISGSFTLDTSKLPADSYSANNIYYDSYYHPGSESFLTASATLTGSSIDVGSQTGGARSYLYGYDNNTPYNFFQAYVEAPGSTQQTRYQYRADGSLERSYYVQDYVTFYTQGTFEFGEVDGNELPIDLPELIGSGWVEMGYYFSESFFDIYGNYTGSTYEHRYAQGQLSALSVREGGPVTDVPEPAALVLLGLGFTGVAAGRRRRHAA